jgi:hypothetical protein
LTVGPSTTWAAGRPMIIWLPAHIRGYCVSASACCCVVLVSTLY